MEQTVDLAGVDADLEKEAEARAIVLAATGDAVAYRQLVERHHRGVYRFLARMVQQPADADDLCQETFARAYARLHTFDTRYRFSTWLYRIALNLARDHARSAKRRELPHDPAASAFEGSHGGARPDEQLEHARLAGRASRALEALRPAYREMIVMKDLEQWTFPEIAKVAGASVPALKIRAIRARRAFRRALEQQP